MTGMGWLKMNPSNESLVLRVSCAAQIGREAGQTRRLVFVKSISLNWWQVSFIMADPYFEQTVNALIYELFFSQELHAAGRRFFELAAAASPARPAPPSESAAWLDWYGEQFKKLSAPGHPLRVALDKLQTLDFVRIFQRQA